MLPCFKNLHCFSKNIDQVMIEEFTGKSKHPFIQIKNVKVNNTGLPA